MSYLDEKEEYAIVESPTGVAPQIILKEGRLCARRYAEFFTANIRNNHTRSAYFRAIQQFFGWIETNYSSLTLPQITPMLVARYIESHPGAALTKNQHLAAIRGLFGWLETGGVMHENPAREVRGVRHRVKRGKTPILSDEEIVTLIKSIDITTLIGLRDRALIGIMFYSFARISAVLGMNIADITVNRGERWLSLHEKGGKVHKVPAHHIVLEYLDAYLESGGHGDKREAPLFQTMPGGKGALTGARLRRHEAWSMIKRRALAAGVSTEACNHTFRASGITNFLLHGGSLDNAQRIAAHEDIRTTALYDRRDEHVALSEIERISLTPRR